MRGRAVRASRHPDRVSRRAEHALAGVVLGLALASACTRAERAGETVRIVPQVHPVQPRRVVFAPERENHLLILEATGLVGFWDVTDAERPVRMAWIPAGAIDAAFSADGTEIVTAGWDGKVRWWSRDGTMLRTSKGAHQRRPLLTHLLKHDLNMGWDHVLVVVFTPDGWFAGSQGAEKLARAFHPYKRRRWSEQPTAAPRWSFSPLPCFTSSLLFPYTSRPTARMSSSALLLRTTPGCMR